MLLNVFNTNVHLFKLYSISIILLLKNNLVAKYVRLEWIYEWFNLQYEKLCKVRKMGRRWIYFASLTKIMRDLWMYYTILGILKAFSW